ncbi:MAG: MATE family efflux transporter [Thermodesulfobacteriota bacterium]
MANWKERWSGRGGWREVLNLSLPLILSTGSWSVQQFIDRVFLSWYSPEAIAAAAPANMLNFSIVCFFIGTAAFVSTFVAQYFGAGQFHRIGPAVWQGVYVSFLGGLMVLSLWPGAETFFRLIGHSPEVQVLEVVYFRILCLGGFPVIGAAALSGFFAGRGRTWPVMWVNLASMVMNIILNYRLIFGRFGFPRLGIAGAGWATIISVAFAFLAFLVMMMTPENNRTFKTVSGWRPEKELFVRLLRFGVPSGIQFFLDLAGFTIFVLLVGRLGTVNLAATNIAFNINMFAFMPMIGTGMAITVLVGQYIGAGRPELAEKSTYSGFHLTFLYMGTVAVLYVVLPDLFIAPFAVQAEDGQYREIFALTVLLLRFVAVYSLFDSMNIIFISALKGAGDTRFVMYALGGASGLVMVLPTFLAVMVLDWSLIACWGFMTAYVVLLGVILWLRFRGGKWKEMRVIEHAPAPRPPDLAGAPAE